MAAAAADAAVTSAKPHRKRVKPLSKKKLEKHLADAENRGARKASA